MVQIKSPAEKLRSEGIQKLINKGPVEFGKSGGRYIRNYTSKIIIPRIKDYFVREFLDDEYTLPSHLRRFSDYNQTRAMAGRMYREISAHTGIPLKDNAYDSKDDEPSLDGFRIGDIGCGDGNLAVQFIENHPEAEYIGMDIQKNRIDALQQRFSDTNYQFVHSDVYNGRYNPTGDLDSETFDFPFPDDYFDLVILRSVFTHMLPADIENYLSEIDRVLKEGGKAWTTWFIIADDSDLDPTGKMFEFTSEHDNFYSLDEDNPERGVAYPRETVNDLLEETSLEIDNEVLGWWRDTSRFAKPATDTQDILVFK